MRALTDSHAHLASVAEELGESALREVFASYLEAWESAGLSGGDGPLLVDVGVDPGDLAERRALAESACAAAGAGGAAFLRMTAGIWPSAEALAAPEPALDALESAIAAHEGSGGRVAAVGEAGLDYHHMAGGRKAQRRLFEAQIEIARRRRLPLVVHSREAFEDTRAILAAARLAAPVVIHCFGYGAEEARAFLDLGCHISFAGNLTYAKAHHLCDACALVPLDRILLETDSPYMNPVPRRGRPSTPLDVSRGYAAAAALRGEAVEVLARTVALNALRIFG